MRDHLNVWLKSVDTSQMQVLDRMVFDINRRALIDINKERFVASSKELIPKTAGSSETPVYERLIEDINRRSTIKQRLEEYSNALEVAKSESPSRMLSKAESEAVFSRLLKDVDRRFDSRQATELYKAKETDLEVQSFTTTAKPMSKAEASQMVLRLNGSSYAGEAEFRQHKLEALQRDKQQREADIALHMANLHHPKRALDPRVQERLTQEQKQPKEEDWITERLNSNPQRTHKRQKESPPKLFTVKESIQSGIRLMHARTYRSRIAVDPPLTQSPPRPISGKSESIVAQLYRSRHISPPPQNTKVIPPRFTGSSPPRYSDPSPPRYPSPPRSFTAVSQKLSSEYGSPRYSEVSEPSSKSRDLTFKIKVTESEYSSEGLTPEDKASEYKRKPIQLRSRPAGLSLQTKESITAKSFISETQKSGRYNYSKAFADGRQAYDQESIDLSYQQSEGVRNGSPIDRSFSPASRRSLARSNEIVGNFERLSPASLTLTPDLMEYAKSSYLTAPILLPSPVGSKVKPSPRLVAREALDLPTGSDTGRPFMSYTENLLKSIPSYAEDSPVTGLESPSEAERWPIYRPKPIARRPLATSSPSRSLKSLQPSQPTIRRQKSSSQDYDI